MTLGEMCAAHGLTVKEFLEASTLPESTAYRWVEGRSEVLNLLLASLAKTKPEPVPSLAPLPRPWGDAIGTPYVAVLDVETLAMSIHAVIGTIGVTVVNVLTGEELGHFYTRIDLSLEQPGRVTDESTLAFWKGLRETHPVAWAEMFDPALPRGTLRRALESLAEFLRFMEAGGREIEVIGNGPEFDNSIIEDACRTEGAPSLWHFRRNQSMRTMVWMGRLLLGVDPKYQIPFEGVPHHAGDDSRHEAKAIVSIVRSFRGSLVVGSWSYPPAGKDKSLELGVGQGAITRPALIEGEG